MNKTLNKAFFWGFFALWLLIAAVNALKKPKEFSENENRYLASFPSFTWESFVEGDYMLAIDDYLSDQFIARDGWIAAQSVSEYALGKRESNGVFIGDGALLDHLDRPDGRAVEGNIRGVKAFCEKYSAPGYIMLVPSAAGIESEKLPAFAPVWDESAFIEEAYSGLGTAVSGVDVCAALAAHSGEYIYYRTDHHWTTAGAYLGYREFCRAAGLSAVDYEAETVSDSFNGTLYSRSGVRFIESDTIEAFTDRYAKGLKIASGEGVSERDDIYFEEFLAKKDKYSYFLGTNQASVTLLGNAKTGKNLVVFKDSYSHCLAPMLLAHYDTVTLIDLRYVGGDVNALLEGIEFDDALFLYSVDTFSHQNDLVKLAY